MDILAPVRTCKSSNTLLSLIMCTPAPTASIRRRTLRSMSPAKCARVHRFELTSGSLTTDEEPAHDEHHQQPHSARRRHHPHAREHGSSHHHHHASTHPHQHSEENRHAHTHHTQEGARSVRRHHSRHGRGPKQEGEENAPGQEPNGVDSGVEGP